MNKQTLNFNTKKEEIISFLTKNKHMVLATCANNKVTARAMCYVNIELDIYFATDSEFTKSKQIQQNPNVAVCISNLQIEGKTEILGNPFEETNKEFCELFKQTHANSYERYMHGKTQTVFKITPTLCTQWKYINNEPCREFLDLNQKLAYQEFYKVITD